ncbi:MAG: hypothetical protein Q7K34_02080 [archaeon]|nr:hypothetical protein [archaeon]
MKRGIIFSVDATYGLLAVFFVLSMLSFYYTGATTTGSFAKKTGSETNDGAIVGFYTNKNGAELGLNDTIDNQEFYECARHQIFDLQPNGINQSRFGEMKNYCRVIEWKKE